MLRSPVLLLILAATLLSGCALPVQQEKPASAPPVVQIAPTAAELAAGARAGVDAAMVGTLVNKPIYRMTPTEAGRYIAFMQEAAPDFRARIAAIGRHNIGQPYSLNLLGEFPYEIHDDLPMFSLKESDCVVFVEHTYAMAMSHSWEEFFWMLQRIRYNKGVIGAATRNHYTELDWNVNNGWLVSDISAPLAGARAATYPMTVDRANFLRTRHKTESKLPIEKSIQAYVPKAMVAEIAGQLKEGDFVNVISTRDGGYWASHVGLVVMGADGKVHFMHSSEPMVREETFESFIERATEREERNARAGKNGQKLAGFKFLRLNDAPVVTPMDPQPRPQAFNAR